MIAAVVVLFPGGSGVSSWATSASAEQEAGCGRAAVDLRPGLWLVSADEAPRLLQPIGQDDVMANMTWSPDGRRVAFTRLRKDGSQGSLVVADAETGELVTPLGRESHVRAVEWLANDRVVVDEDPPGDDTPPQIVSQGIDGTSHVLYRATPGYSYLLAPAPDGRVFFVDSPTGKLMVVNGDGSGLREVAADASHLGAKPAVSPDGRHLAALIGGQRVILDTVTGEQLRLGPIGEVSRYSRPSFSWSPDSTVAAFTIGGTTLYGLDGRVVPLASDGWTLGLVLFGPGDQMVFSEIRRTEVRAWLLGNRHGSERRQIIGSGTGAGQAVVGSAFVSTQFHRQNPEQYPDQEICWSPIDGSPARAIAEVTHISALVGSGPHGRHVAVVSVS